MTDAINPKLLVVLALAIAVAGFGGWRLLSAEDAATDVGFGPSNELPIAVTPESEGSSPVANFDDDNGRNPFARSDGGGDSFAPVPVEGEDEPSDGESPAEDSATEPSPEPQAPVSGSGTAPPVFPDPGLVDEGPSRGDARDDTSFEG